MPLSDDRRQKGQEFLQAEIAKLQAHAKTLEDRNKALIEEYEQASDEDAPEKVKKNIRARIPQALLVIDELMQVGNDGVRAALAKWVVDRGLMPDQLGGIDAEMQKLAKLMSEVSVNEKVNNS